MCGESMIVILVDDEPSIGSEDVPKTTEWECFAQFARFEMHEVEFYWPGYW
jgi:hypothetical protein